MDPPSLGDQSQGKLTKKKGKSQKKTMNTKQNGLGCGGFRSTAINSVHKTKGMGKESRFRRGRHLHIVVFELFDEHVDGVYVRHVGEGFFFDSLDYPCVTSHAAMFHKQIDIR
jgi:hypothetical protein